MKYGKLTIREFSHQKGRDTYYFCKCDCGNERLMNTRHILRGATKTCGCTRVRLNKEDKLNIALDYEAGAEIKELSTKYNASTKVIERSIKEHGLEFRSILTKEQREEIKIKYELGMESKDIAKEYGVSSFSVRKSVLTLGGKMRAPGTPLILSKEEVDFAKEMYEAKESSLNIAKVLDTTPTVVLLALRKRGVKARDKFESSKRHELNDNAFADPTRDALYWAGFIGADGCIYNNQLSISIQTQDYGHLVKFKEFVGYGHTIKKEKDKGAYTIKFSSHKMCEDLKKYGITKRKSLTYSPPDFCVNSPDFWRGMVDGDGCIRIGKDGKPTLSMVGSFDVMEQFKKWVGRFSDTKAKVSPHVNIFQFSVYGRKAMPVFSELYKDNPRYYLDRKAKVAENVLGIKLHDYVV